VIARVAHTIVRFTARLKLEFARKKRCDCIFFLTFVANNLIYESHCDFLNRKI